MNTERLNEIKNRPVINGPAESMLVEELVAAVENLEHFKSAYSRALDFVDEQHFPPVETKPDDDPFFSSPIGNCCATDILIAQLSRK